MPKISKSRLLKSIPLLAFLLSILASVYLAWAGYPGDVVATLAFGPAFLLFLVVIALIRLQTAIIIQFVVMGAWLQYGHGPYLTLIITTLIGLKLAAWFRNWWRGAIQRAKAKEAFSTLTLEGAGGAKTPGDTRVT